MASFTGVGDNVELNVTDRREAVAIALSGTYDMDIVLQRERGSPGSGAWEDIKHYLEADATVADTYYTRNFNEKLRLYVVVDTSGTCTATLTNASSEEYPNLTLRAPDGTVVMRFDQAGAHITGDITITGGLNLPDAVVLPNIEADLVFSNANPEIIGNDTDGVLYVSPETTKDLGGNVAFYGAAHATKAGDIELRNTTTVKLGYDLSALKWVFADDVHFSVANPELLGGDTDGALFVSSGATAILGGNVVLYGDTHATKAGDIELRNDATIKLNYDLSATKWVFADDVHFSVANPELLGGDTDGALLIGPSTTSALGGNVVLYGDTHATKAGDIELRNTAATVMNYDHSLTKFTFNEEIRAQNLSSADKFVLRDDFYGTWAIGDAGPADTWSTTAGSGAATELATTVAASINGTVTMKSSTADGTNAANNTTLTGINLGWKADQGGLAIEARLKIDDIVEAYVFVGFTDVISTTVESPVTFTDGTDDAIADAGDACGIVFTGDSTTQEFAQLGVKATALTAETFSGSAPVNDTYVVLRVEVSATGGVRGYINGVAIGAETANAITATTAVTPVIVVGNTAAAATIMTIDYVQVEQNR